jgi:hypothetical protein
MAGMDGMGFSAPSSSRHQAVDTATGTSLDSLPDLLDRARAHYIEMPGLSLTRAQAQRLWALGGPACNRVLSALVDAGFLRQAGDGRYILA